MNIGAKIRIMDPIVTKVANCFAMPDYLQDAGRSIAGVKYSVPANYGAAPPKTP